MVNTKEEFWHGMDLKDLESAGAFVPRKVWDDFIIEKPSYDGIKITPVDFTKRR